MNEYCKITEKFKHKNQFNEPGEEQRDKASKTKFPRNKLDAEGRKTEMLLKQERNGENQVPSNGKAFGQNWHT